MDFKPVFYGFYKLSCLFGGVLAAYLAVDFLLKIVMVLNSLNWSLMEEVDPASFGVYVLLLGTLTIFVLYKVATNLFKLSGVDLKWN